MYVNKEEKNLHYALIALTKGFTHADFLAYRKDRSWEKYNNATPVDRLKMIMREISVYKKGYAEDSNVNNRDYGDSTDEFY